MLSCCWASLVLCEGWFLQVRLSGIEANVNGSFMISPIFLCNCQCFPTVCDIVPFRGLRSTLWIPAGGRAWTRLIIRKNDLAKETAENAQTPTSRGHALLGVILPTITCIFGKPLNLVLAFYYLTLFVFHPS